MDSPALRQALRDAAQQAISEGDSSDEDTRDRRVHKAADRLKQDDAGDESSLLLDSLLALVTQDVGIDPHEGSVQRAIWRVRVMKLNLATARQSLDNTREEIFKLAATAEELKALKEMEDEADLDSLRDDESLRERRRQLQDEAIAAAKADGRLERKKLGAKQAGRVGLMLYNLGVGVLCDHLAIQHGEEVLNDFQRVQAHLFEEGGWTAAMAWVSLAAYHEEFLRIPADMKQILTEAPAQLVALQAMIGTVSVLKRNNRIPGQDPEPGDSFESLEDF